MKQIYASMLANFKTIILSESGQLQNTTYCSVHNKQLYHQVHRDRKRQELLGARRSIEMKDNLVGVSFRDGENALKLDNGYGYPSELQKKGKISSIYFKLLN